jgi:hypothetical protein
MTACKRVCLTGTIRVPLPPKEAITPSTPTGNAPGHRGGTPVPSPPDPRGVVRIGLSDRAGMKRLALAILVLAGLVAVSCTGPTATSCAW